MSDQQPSNDSAQASRRDFVKKSTLGTAALGLGSVYVSPLMAAEDMSKKKLKVGVVGLGGRGTGAVSDILRADPNTILWSSADIFEKSKSRLNGLKKRFAGRIDTGNGEREFIGFDAYRKVIESGVDIVLLTSTPAFRPQHFEAVINAGKHAFIEKPFALDVPGLKRIVESAKKAASNGQSVVTGLVWRYSPHLMELHKRIQDGAIGDVLSTSSSYCGGGRPNKMPDIKFKPAKMPDMEWALRYWQSYLELGGDCALEYMIHGIDRMSWAMGDEMPVKCYANGANVYPLNGANAWDNFSLRFVYADGRTADFLGRQLPRTYSASGDDIIGTKGQAFGRSGSASIVKDGKVVWETRGGLDYVNEHKVLTSHIRSGKVYNDVLDQFDTTHAICIMGRSAAYTGQLLTDKQLMDSKDLLLKTEDVTFDSPFTARPAAQPGITKFS